MAEQDRLQLVGSVLASVADTESARFARTLGTALSQLERQLLGLVQQARAGKPGALAKVGRLLQLRRELRTALTTSGYRRLVERASLDAVERMAQAVASRRAVTGAASLGRVTGARLTALARLMAADLLGLKPQTLRKWRVTGGGPPYVRLGGRVAYRRADVDAWIADRTFTSTAAETVSRSPA